MLFYVFVAFVGLNNNTILAKQNIEFGSVSSDWYPEPAENASIEATPILNIIGPDNKLVILLFSKDGVNWSKVMIKTFIMLLQKISISDKCGSSDLSIHQRKLKNYTSS